jgi:hypothetical protein
MFRRKTRESFKALTRRIEKQPHFDPASALGFLSQHLVIDSITDPARAAHIRGRLMLYQEAVANFSLFGIPQKGGNKLWRKAYSHVWAVVLH